MISRCVRTRRRMTTYGTIPASSSVPSNLDYISRAKEQLRSGLGERRPWRQVFNFRTVGLPSSVGEATSRIRTNVAYFRMNYAIVVLLILFLSLLWHPISMIVFVAMMAAWLFLYFLRDEPLVIFGRIIDDLVVLVALAVVTLVLLLLTHAKLNILVSLLVGFAVVLVHAALWKTDDLSVDEETGGLLASTSVPPPSS